MSWIIVCWFVFSLRPFYLNCLIAAEDEREDDSCLDLFVSFSLLLFFFLFIFFFWGFFLLFQLIIIDNIIIDFFFSIPLHRDTHIHRIIDFLIMSTVLYRFLKWAISFVYLHRTWWINCQMVAYKYQSPSTSLRFFLSLSWRCIII